jgi:Zn-dependent M16 (insulinase) family peptidase
VSDDKGLPHTLEHLIFCGSHDYPERGYLDRLSTLCQGHGTNAYTADDHTCYTFATSSLDGLLRMLPVYLDHIFRPTIDEAVVAREVFHRNEEGGRGVVYCEMGGREWSEADQLDLALRRGLVKGMGSEMSTYAWECGGRTKDISTLTVEEIRDYHQRFYRADNAVIVLAGGPALRESIERVLEIMGNVKFLQEHTLNPLSSPLIDAPQSCSIRFPANDETLGSVGFAWPGPPSHDLYTITALHVLLRMLKDTSASPLYQQFVERPDPVASDIDYEVKQCHRSMILLVFSGVPTQKNGEFELLNESGDSDGDVGSNLCYLEEGLLVDELYTCIQEFKNNEKVVKERLVVALKSLTIKFQESLEDDPHEMCASMIVPEIIRSHWHSGPDRVNSYGESLTLIPCRLERLAKEPLSFWLKLLDDYILKERPVEVRMHPSREMNKDIKKWEAEQLKDIPTMNLSKEENYSQQPIPSFPPSLPERVKCSTSQADGLQLINIPATGVKRLTVALDLTNVPGHLWPALVLLQELIFQSDLNLTEEIVSKYNTSAYLSVGLTPYQGLVELLSGTFSTFEASVGFDNNIFSIGYLDSHFILCLHGRVKFNKEEMIGLAMSILAGTVFTVERTSEVLENLISQLKDTWGEANSVLDARLTERLYESKKLLSSPKRTRACMCPMVESAIGMAKQTHFLVDVRTKLDNDPEGLITMLEELRTGLLSAPMLVNFGNANSTEEPLSSPEPLPLSEPFWKNSYNLPKHGALEGSMINENGTVELIPMCDITASYLAITIPIDLLPTGSPRTLDDIDRMLSISLMCQLLSYTEGPLYRRIRGAGLAYGASVSTALWSGLLTFDLSDSSDPVKALSVFHELLSDIIDEASGIRRPSIITEETVRTAQAVQLYQFVAERSTPTGLFATASRCALRGLPAIGSEEERIWNERMMQLTPVDILKYSIEVIKTLMDGEKSIRLLAVPASRLEEIRSGLSALDIPSAINNIVDLCNLL